MQKFRYKRNIRHHQDFVLSPHAIAKFSPLLLIWIDIFIKKFQQIPTWDAHIAFDVIGLPFMSSASSSFFNQSEIAFAIFSRWGYLPQFILVPFLEILQLSSLSIKNEEYKNKKNRIKSLKMKKIWKKHKQKKSDWKVKHLPAVIFVSIRIAAYIVKGFDGAVHGLAGGSCRCRHHLCHHHQRHIASSVITTMEGCSFRRWRIDASASVVAVFDAAMCSLVGGRCTCSGHQWSIGASTSIVMVFDGAVHGLVGVSCRCHYLFRLCHQRLIDSHVTTMMEGPTRRWRRIGASASAVTVFDDAVHGLVGVSCRCRHCFHRCHQHRIASSITATMEGCSRHRQRIGAFDSVMMDFDDTMHGLVGGRRDFMGLLLVALLFQPPATPLLDNWRDCRDW